MGVVVEKVDCTITIAVQFTHQRRVSDRVERLRMIEREDVDVIIVSQHRAHRV